MKGKIKQEKGVTMLALVVTVIILLIITNMLIYNAQDSIHINQLTNLYNDIELLKEKVSDYYNEYGKIPAKIKYTNINQLSSVLSINNDTGDFYVIDLEAMQGITLNYGRDYETIKSNEANCNNYTDVYIINENSHNIFYVQGISIQENNEIKTYYTDYTQPDETTIDLRYIDGILIPEGYYYIGKTKDSMGNESIVISQNKNEDINNTTNQYIWQKQISSIEKVPDSIKLSKDQDENEFIKSVNHYKGYFKNKNKTADIDVIYLSIQENKWSETYTKNGEYIDKNGDVAYIPQGFRVSLAEGTNEIKNGLVITDEIDQNGKSIGNEFVWIPVDYFEEFIREDFGTPKIDNTNFITTEETEGKYYEPSGDGKTIDETASDSIKEVQAMYKSVKEYKGFYIGRYETGIDLDTPRTSDSDTSANPVVKKNKYIYNYITWGKSMTDETGGAVEKARSMYKNSTLCYGVQWDAVLRWINKDYSINYILKDSTGKGNYDTNGNLIKAGNDENYQIKNIYDLAGNVSEWTMESYGTIEKITRGGKSGGKDAITYRETNNIDIKSGLCGFRITLYI